jgi:hypothetical protein
MSFNLIFKVLIACLPLFYKILVILVWVLPLFIAGFIYLADYTKQTLSNREVLEITNNYGLLRRGVIHIRRVLR